MIWWFIFLAVILILIGIAYLRGKCDGFIAGYNTSSPEKKNKYDIKRLRRTATMSSSAFGLQALGPFNPQGDGEAADLC